jgi:transcriptional regulator with XRE-family HTH domain
MGRSRRARPVRLAKKLRQIRTALGFTQQQMFEQLGETKTPLYRGHIGEYETGTRDVPVLVVLRYARIAGVYVDVLIDDDLDLPDVLPPVTKEGGIMRVKRAGQRR